MTRLTWITRPPYADQWIALRDADAQTAKEHHWGFARAPDISVPGDIVTDALNAFDPEADQPSLDAWLEQVAAGYDPWEPPGPPPSPPTAIALDPSTIERDQLVGTEVGTLTATDPDQAGGHVFTTSDTNFKIDGDKVQVARRPGPNAGDYPMSVTATDDDGLSFTGIVTITVTSVT